MVHVLRAQALRPVAAQIELSIQLEPGPFNVLIRDLDEDVGSKILKFAADQG